MGCGRAVNTSRRGMVVGVGRIMAVVVVRGRGMGRGVVEVRCTVVLVVIGNSGGGENSGGGAIIARIQVRVGRERVVGVGRLVVPGGGELAGVGPVGGEGVG